MVGVDVSVGEFCVLGGECFDLVFLAGCDFNDELAGVFEELVRVFDEWFYEVESIVSGAECVGGFVVFDVGEDVIPFMVGDVGWVGDDEVILCTEVGFVE